VVTSKRGKGNPKITPHTWGTTPRLEKGRGTGRSEKCHKKSNGNTKIKRPQDHGRNEGSRADKLFTSAKDLGGRKGKGIDIVDNRQSVEKR